MAKDTDPNQTLHATSFLQGHNQAYVEQLYAIWAANPGAVDPSWSEYFESLRDEPLAVREEAAGAPWQRRDWPPTANGELVAALDGQWDSVPGAKEIAKKVAAKADKEGKTLDKEALRHAVLDSIR
ncbi:MAG: 2-oxoglutarate dehydrogenase E1 component, partial [Pseudomonadota bacterium]